MNNVCVCHQTMRVVSDDESVPLRAIDPDEPLKMQTTEVNVVNVQENNYEKLRNLPKINSIELIGNRSLEEIGVEDVFPVITELEIRDVLRRARGGN